MVKPVAAGERHADSSGLPPITAYDSYRKYLSDAFAAKRRARPGLSLRRFAQLAGFASPNYLQVIMQGGRNLSPTKAPDVARALGLRGSAREVFVALVRIEAAKDERERSDAQRELLRARKNLLTSYISPGQAGILGNWYPLLVRELVLLPDFRPEGAWIARRLGALITPAQATAALRRLQEEGFVNRDATGRYVVANAVIDTGDHTLSAALNDQHHAQTLETWARHLHELSPDEQERGLLNIPISNARLPELRERIRRFQDEIIGWLESDPAPDRLVQLGTYLIPYPEP